MSVRIRLRNEGAANHPYWWLVVQPSNKNLKGRYLERVGYWIPRKTKTVQRAIILNKHRIKYWLGNGATCTKGVHRLLENYDLVPPMPIKFGSKHTYEKPEKEYPLEYYKLLNPKDTNSQFVFKQALQEQMTIMQRKARLQTEAMASLGEQKAIDQLEEAKTTDIESDDPDVFERKKKFEELQKRFEKHRIEKAHLRGNDLRYNIYMRKMQKLTRMDLGLDVEGYKDYINNLKQFAHLNQDFQLFANDSLKVDKPDYREIVVIHDKVTGKVIFDKKLNEEDIQLDMKAKKILSVLYKFRRESAGFIGAKDRELIDELMSNMKAYMVGNVEIFEILKILYDKKQLKLQERKALDKLDLEDVKDIDLENASVSRKEFEHIKLLLSIDEQLFLKENEQSTAHNWIIDLRKYEGMSLSKDIKEILYRPPKVRKLYEKYWDLTKSQVARKGRELQIIKTGGRRADGYGAKFPQKSQEELDLLDKLLNKVQEFIDNDIKTMPALKLENLLEEQKSQKEELTDKQEQQIENIHEDYLQKMFKERKQMSPEQKQAQINDKIDEVNTTDVEEWEDQDAEDFFERHDINMAKLFLGRNGGYTLRQLKKMYLKSQQDKIIDMKEQKELRDLKAELQDDQELASQNDEVSSIQEGEPEQEKKAEEEIPKVNEKLTQDSQQKQGFDSDDSGLDTELEQIDDESFNKIVESVNETMFETEQEAEEFFKKKIIEWSKKKKQNQRPKDLPPYGAEDERAKRDPYYAALKEDEEVDSKISNEYFLDKRDRFIEMDRLANNVGRYPIGFRHYENFENYKTAYPDATLHEYTQEMNRQCEFHEYKEMCRTAFLQNSETPYFRWRYSHYYNKLDNPLNAPMPETYAYSPEFDQQCKLEFQKRVKFHLLERSWFKLVDALEEVTDLWSFGNNFNYMPDYNIFLPLRQHLLKKPNLIDDSKDNLSYKYNELRVSPVHHLNPLKAYPLPPSTLHYRERPALYKLKFNVRMRRLSHVKGGSRGYIYKPIQAFSTTTTSTTQTQQFPNVYGQGFWNQAKGLSTFGLYQSDNQFFLNNQKK